MRIVSLLPSATEIVAALGLADQLVAISHECDYPPEAVAGKYRLTRSALPKDLSQYELDAIVSQRIRGGESLYLLDEKLLQELAPDVIFTQELCDVCAVSYSTVVNAACKLSTDPRVVSLEPTSIEGIFDTIRAVGQIAGLSERAEETIAALRQRLARVQKKTQDNSPRPRAFAMEWLDPPYNAGHWVPEMFSIAGAQEILGCAGKPSVRLTWDQIIASQPEYILLMPCGYSLTDIVDAEGCSPLLKSISFPDGWWDLPALQNGNVIAVNANSYFSRSGPRIVDGVELIAKIFHPEILGEPAKTDARRITLVRSAQ
ncbi:cobalamin-binding protein [bacterium]|nr:cobalamin-binding protein [bacterium]